LKSVNKERVVWEECKDLEVINLGVGDGSVNQFTRTAGSNPITELSRAGRHHRQR
jgi:hypothetical protein